MLLAIDKRTAARSILARAATAKTPGPLKRNCTLLAPRLRRFGSRGRERRANRIDRSALSIGIGSACRGLRDRQRASRRRRRPKRRRGSAGAGERAN